MNAEQYSFTYALQKLAFVTLLLQHFVAVKQPVIIAIKVNKNVYYNIKLRLRARVVIRQNFCLED